MELSGKARKELKIILLKEFGEKTLEFSDSEFNELGVALLKLTAISLKRKVNVCDQSKDVSKT